LTHVDGRSRPAGAASDLSHRKVDDNANREAPDGTSRADIDRASQRFAQGSAPVADGSVNSASQARDRLAQLQLDIARDPAAVVNAFKGINANGFLAAIAKPSG
jgi:hypothetical protein